MSKKRFLPVTIFMVFLFSIFIFTKMEAAAANTVAITKVNFPDDKFREYLKKFDLNSDNYFDQQEIDKVTVIDVSFLRLSDLQGIEYFTNIEFLNCSFNNLSQINIASNVKLKKLYCHMSGLLDLDLSHNSKLEELSLHSNNFSYLDISNCPGLINFNSDVVITYPIYETSINTKDIHGFDMNRTSNWSNCTIKGTVVSIKDATENISYLYDIGLGKKMLFYWSCKAPVTPPKKSTQNISMNFPYIQQYGDKPFSLNAKTNGNGKLSFVSNNTKIAIVDGNGIVRIIGTGRVTITAYATETETYSATSTPVTIIAIKKKTTISGCASSYTKTYGDKSFSLNARTDGDGRLTFSSGNTKVATVSNSGMVTVKGIGSTAIKISTGSTANCEAASKSVSISVKAKTASIAGVASSYDKIYGDRPFTVKPKVSGNRKISFSSSNKRIFIVDSRGKVTIKGCGKATLTLTAASSNGYTKVTKKVTITVKPKKMAITVSAKRKAYIQIDWKRDTKVSGYQICCAKDSKFKKSPVIQNITGYKTTSKTLKRGKGTYYVRVRSYVLSGNTKIYSSYSSTKKVTIK